VPRVHSLERVGASFIRPRSVWRLHGSIADCVYYIIYMQRCQPLLRRLSLRGSFELGARNDTIAVSIDVLEVERLSSAGSGVDVGGRRASNPALFHRQSLCEVRTEQLLRARHAQSGPSIRAVCVGACRRSVCQQPLRIFGH
jgi:hypothetical protein